jgi:hypothetical protein
MADAQTKCCPHTEAPGTERKGALSGGHDAWIALVLMFGILALRFLAAPMGPDTGDPSPASQVMSDRD